MMMTACVHGGLAEHGFRGDVSYGFSGKHCGGGESGSEERSS